MKSQSEIQEIAHQYIFYKCPVSNHQSELMKQAFVDGYTKAMNEYFSLIKEYSDKIQLLSNEEMCHCGINQLKGTGVLSYLFCERCNKKIR